LGGRVTNDGGATRVGVDQGERKPQIGRRQAGMPPF
jgi:hypothetical protein